LLLDTFISATKWATAVMLQTCIQELSGSGLGWDTKCPEAPHPFPQALKIPG